MQAREDEGCDSAETARVYVYDPQRYLFDVRLAAYVSVVVLPVSVISLGAGVLAPLMALLAVVSAYTLLNTFVAHAYPRVIVREGSVLTLESFGRRDKLDLSCVRRLSVRETPKGLKAYVRVNGGGLLRNRYFLSLADMADEDGNEASDVYQLLLDTEARLDPDGLRVRARRQQGR